MSTQGGPGIPTPESLIVIVDQEHLGLVRNAVVHRAADIGPVQDRQRFFGRGVLGYDFICPFDDIGDPIDIVKGRLIIGEAKKLERELCMQKDGNNDAEAERKDEYGLLVSRSTLVEKNDPDGDQERVKNG